MQRYIPYSKQTISSRDIQLVSRVLKSGNITQGEEIKKFENKLAKFCHVKFAAVLSSGTAALHAAYFAGHINKGDEIITSPMTFAATANAALYLGAKPIFSDINEENGIIDSDLIVKKITKKTKALIPVHYSGLPCEMEKIQKVGKKHGLVIIEDACHALGAVYKKQLIGSCSYSDMAVFSFHPVKHITTGEGGAVLTNNKDFYEKVCEFRTHGITKNEFVNKTQKDGDWYYEMKELGFNYRLTDFQAALGRSQLDRLERFIRIRKQIAKTYTDAFKNNQFFDFIQEKTKEKSSWHLFPILLKDKYLNFKKKIFENMRLSGIGVQVHYIPVYFHPFYRDLGYQKGECPNAEKFYQREISIPIFPLMRKKDTEYVIDRIFKIFKKIDKNI